MAIFGTRFKMVKRAAGRSAVAGAAYDARDRIYDVRRGRVQDFRWAHQHERLVVDLGTMAPESAPDEWRAGPAWPGDEVGMAETHAAREILWNAAEEAEKGVTAQTARRVYLSLPRELTPQQQCAVSLRIMEYFTVQGMCVSGTVHDNIPGRSPNPHLHLQLSVRPCDADGFTALKRRNAYRVRDSDGHEELLLPDELKSEIAAGHQWEKTFHYDLVSDRGKRTATAVLTPTEAAQPEWAGYTRRSRYPITEKRDVMPWNDQRNAKIWRGEIADMINGALAEARVDARVDPRSYKEQGLDLIPQVHEGEAIAAIERRAQAEAEAAGKAYVPITEVRQQNLEIQAVNDATALISDLEAFRDELAEACADTTTELVPERVTEPAVRNIIGRAAEHQRGRYPGIAPRTMSWAKDTAKVVKDAGIDASQYGSDDAVLSRFASAADRASAWSALVRRRGGPEGPSRAIGAWGDAMATVLRAVARTGEIMRTVLAHPATPIRAVERTLRRWLDPWLSAHESSLGGGGSSHSSSSPAASSPSPSPSRSHDLTR